MIFYRKINAFAINTSIYEFIGFPFFFRDKQTASLMFSMDCMQVVIALNDICVAEYRYTFLLSWIH